MPAEVAEAQVCRFRAGRPATGTFLCFKGRRFLLVALRGFQRIPENPAQYGWGFIRIIIFSVHVALPFCVNRKQGLRSFSKNCEKSFEEMRHAAAKGMPVEGRLFGAVRFVRGLSEGDLNRLRREYW